MIGEQTVTCRYKAAGPQDTDIEIQMTVQVERPSDPYGDVLTELRYERIFPEKLEDGFHQRLYNGVHGGIALSNTSHIPNTLILLKLLELKVSPSPQSIVEAKINLGYLLEATISGVVETLLRSMENLRSGKESYYEG